MARSRNIKPGFFTNDVLGELPALTRLLFAGLWTICDRDGRVEDRPKKIRAEVLPYDQCEPDDMLQALHAAGFILRYEAAGKRLIQVLAWADHQNPHMKEAASTLPAPCLSGASPVLVKDEQSPSPERAGLIPDSLSSDSLSSVPTVLTALPSSDAALTKAELWAAGKSILESQGMAKAQCGSFVGKLVKDYGDQVVVEAVRSAVVTRPADAAEYLKATCMHAAGQRKQAEPEWRTEQRTRTQQAAPGVAAGKSHAEFFIDAEVKHVSPHALGGSDIRQIDADLRASVPPALAGH